MEKKTLFAIHHALHDPSRDSVKVIIEDKSQVLAIQTNSNKCRYVQVKQDVLLVQQNTATGSKYARLASEKNKQLTWIQTPAKWGLLVDDHVEKLCPDMKLSSSDDMYESEEDDDEASESASDKENDSTQVQVELDEATLLKIHHALHDAKNPKSIQVGPSTKPVTLNIETSSKQGLRCVHTNGVTIMVQNPDAKSEYAKEAKKGIRITWVMPLGRFRGKWGMIREDKIEQWISAMKKSTPQVTVSTNQVIKIDPIVSKPSIIIQKPETGDCKPATASQVFAHVTPIRPRKKVEAPKPVELPDVECKTVIRSRKHK